MSSTQQMANAQIAEAMATSAREQAELADHLMDDGTRLRRWLIQGPQRPGVGDHLTEVDEALIQAAAQLVERVSALVRKRSAANREMAAQARMAADAAPQADAASQP